MSGAGRVIAALLVLLAAPAVCADDEPRRELALELGYATLDLGSIASFDLGDADGPLAGVSFGWPASKALELGVRVTLFDLELDDGQPLEGSTAGVFLTAHRPAGKTIRPFARLGFGIPAGNLGSRYRYSYDLGVGLKIDTGDRMGLSIAVAYRNLRGEDFVPDGGVVELGAAWRLRF